MQYCSVIRSMACTKDGGQTWAYPFGPAQYTDLQLLDEEYGWSVGAGQAGDVVVYRTTNGGTTWDKVAQLDQRVLDSRHQMKFINRQEGWLAVGAGDSNPAALLRTVDGGETWAEEADGVYFNDTTQGFAFDVVPGGAGWLASLYSGMLLRRAESGPVVPGDANGDGKLDSGDLLEIVKILNDETPAGAGTDCNQDGKTDVGDLICVILKLEQK